MTSDSQPKREKKESDTNPTGDKGVKKIDKLYEMTNQKWASKRTEDKTDD
jgi:hypothetical protein